MKIARFRNSQSRVRLQIAGNRIARRSFGASREITAPVRIRFTYTLIVLLIVVFALEVLSPALVDILAFSPADFLARPWSALTAMFVHADIEHIAANLVVLWFFGLAAERGLGRIRSLVVFLLGGFAGELASVVLYAPDMLSLGASAGIFALIGVAAIVRPLETEAVKGWTGWSNTITPMPLAFLAMIYVAYNAIGALSGPSDIAYGAHFAGLAVGLAIGIFSRKRMQKRRK